MYYSKLKYCLLVFGNGLRMDQYIDWNSSYSQNNLNRLLLNARYDTTTEELLSETKELSVNQLSAFHTVLTAFKSIRSGKPRYLADNLMLQKPEPAKTFSTSSAEHHQE